jgi:hypothetical protein
MHQAAGNTPRCKRMHGRFQPFGPTHNERIASVLASFPWRCPANLAAIDEDKAARPLQVLIPFSRVVSFFRTSPTERRKTYAQIVCAHPFMSAEMDAQKAHVPPAILAYSSSSSSTTKSGICHGQLAIGGTYADAVGAADGEGGGGGGGGGGAGATHELKAGGGGGAPQGLNGGCQGGGKLNFRTSAMAACQSRKTQET